MPDFSRRPDPDSPVVVGRVTNPHGIRGEVKVESLSDFPERFARGSLLWVKGEQYRVRRGRVQGRSVILELEGVTTREQAEALRGAELTVPEPAELDAEDVFYVHDLVGMRVDDREGTRLGNLDDVLSTGSNDVYVVHGERGELLLPALDDVILEVDVAAAHMVVDVPPGIEFHARAAKPASRRRRPAQKPDGGGYERPETEDGAPDAGEDGAG